MINIAIDGPAGAGKSTIAKRLAKELDLLYVDTGAMYRTVALKGLGLGSIDKLKDDKELEARKIEVRFLDGKQNMFLDGENVTELIRTPEVSLGASDVGKIPGVRRVLTSIQRDFAMKNNVVMEGRDIGSFVLTDANYKFFLDRKSVV